MWNGSHSASQVALDPEKGAGAEKINIPHQVLVVAMANLVFLLSGINTNHGLRKANLRDILTGQILTIHQGVLVTVLALVPLGITNPVAGIDIGVLVIPQGSHGHILGIEVKLQLC